MNTRFTFIALLLTLAITSCTTGEPILPSGADDQTPTLNSTYSPDSGRALWGLWQINIDPNSLEASVIPARFGTFHANVRQFLEEGPCTNCLAIVPPIVGTAYGIDATLRIDHPFPGDTYYTGFDVRGILMLQGTFLFPDLWFTTTRAAAGEWALLNPDGYTPIFNADYTEPGIFGYSHGKMIPPTWPDPPNNMNAFKAYYSEGQSEDDGGRRAFFAGDSIERTYEIQLVQDEPLMFWYAVDASWEPPTGDEPYDLTDFPPEANCTEPYRFDFSVVAGELYPDSGSVTIGVDIYDHQGLSEPWAVYYEVPECFDGIGSVSEPPVYISGDKHNWEINITNFNGGLDPELGAELLVGWTFNEPDPFTGPIDGWGRFTIPVSSGTEPTPEVYSINPNWGELGTLVENVAIEGANFFPGLTTLLQKVGETDIIGIDLDYIDSENLTCNFDLIDGVSGFWDVVVTNPGGAFGTLFDGFEATRCNANLHENYLGTGDFGGGTHMTAYDAIFVHDTGTLTDGEFLGYISGFAGTVVISYIIDTLTPEEGHPLGSGWGNPHILSWPVPLSIDVSEELGQFFIVWDDTDSFVEVWHAETGKYAGETNASSSGRVFCLDTDGSGGFWNAYFPEYGFAPGIKHFTPDGPQPGELVDDTANSFLLPEVWGTPTELICIPDDTLLVLTGAEQGKIRAYDLTTTPPTYTGSLDQIFSGDLAGGSYPSKPCDMAADWSDPYYADCRIVVFGNLESGGVELIKIGADLTVWAGPISISSNHYHSMDINPDTGDIALWPRHDGTGPGEYALIEQPPDW